MQGLHGVSAWAICGRLAAVDVDVGVVGAWRR
jgi:hypothetical protein